MFVHFAIYNNKTNLPKVIKCSIEFNVFLFLSGFKLKMKFKMQCVSWFWKCGNLALEIFLKVFEQSLMKVFIFQITQRL